MPSIYLHDVHVHPWILILKTKGFGYPLRDCQTHHNKPANHMYSTYVHRSNAVLIDRFATVFSFSYQMIQPICCHPHCLSCTSKADSLPEFKPVSMLASEH